MMQDQQTPSLWREVLWWASWTTVSVIVVVIALALVIPWAITGYLPDWSGLGSKTLWDWLQLLTVPVILAVGGFLLNRSAQVRDNASATRREQATALEDCLKNLSDLLLGRDATTRQSLEFAMVVRAQTAATIPRVDARGKELLLQFLRDSRITARGAASVYLSGIDLSGIHLAGVNLSGADLTGATFDRAILYDARLQQVDLTGANLRGVDLRYANLQGAILIGADLTEADFTGANVAEGQWKQAASTTGMRRPDGAKLR